MTDTTKEILAATRLDRGQAKNRSISTNLDRLSVTLRRGANGWPSRTANTTRIGDNRMTIDEIKREQSEIFSRRAFNRACETVCELFEKSAPTVADWADTLFQAKDNDVTLADLLLLVRLSTEDTQPNTAANLVYHIMEQRGQSTTGHAGF